MEEKGLSKKFIEVREVIRKKNANLLRWMPRFLTRYVERVIHQDEINQIMSDNEGLIGLDFINALIDKDLKVHVKVEGAENIPTEDGVIFASNHPLGGLDGIAFMYVVGKIRKDVQFLVNDILLNLKPLEPLFVPVNTLGAQGRKNLALIEQAYAADHALLVFPAGLVSRKKGGAIQDLAWKKSFISKAKKYQKDIIPVHIDGRNSNFFYNLSRIREKIGIKANIEMFYLPDEMFKQKNKTVTIRIGKPVPYTQFDGSKTEQEWANDIKEEVYRLGKA